MQLDCSYFDKPWHFHKEFELVLINKSHGTRFIGNDVRPFKDGDLALIGSRIPHLYRNSEEYYKGKKNLRANSIFIHFTNDFLGPSFFDIPEMRAVKNLLAKSMMALEITGKSKLYVIKKMHEMQHQSTTVRLMSLLDILIYLSQSRYLKKILSTEFSMGNVKDTERINKVFEYVMKNYMNLIYIKNVAAELNMSVPSFSRYFKFHTRKTFSNFVTEIRIGNACKLLQENNHSIAEICYLSGFENLSNFNRHFKNQTGLIPKVYQQRFLQNALAIL
jgi:AraC-like DNA-binding protein